MKRFGDFLWGLLFITLGLIIGLNALGITDINIFLMGGGLYLLLFHVL